MTPTAAVEEFKQEARGQRTRRRGRAHVVLAWVLTLAMTGCAMFDSPNSRSTSPPSSTQVESTSEVDDQLQMPPGWQYRGLMEHEGVAPGLGRSYRFVGPEGRLDLYRYDLHLTGLLPDLEDPRTLQHFQQIKEDLIEVGGFTGVKHISDDRLVVDGIPFIRARFVGLQKSQGVVTEAWLTVRNGRFLKLRITHSIKLDPAARQRISVFIRGVIRSFGHHLFTLDVQDSPNFS